MPVLRKPEPRLTLVDTGRGVTAQIGVLLATNCVLPVSINAGYAPYWTQAGGGADEIKEPMAT